MKIPERTNADVTLNVLCLLHFILLYILGWKVLFGPTEHGRESASDGWTYKLCGRNFVLSNKMRFQVPFLVCVGLFFDLLDRGRRPVRSVDVVSLRKSMKRKERP